MKAKIEIVKIGPKEAEKLLTSQVKEQRHLRNSHVKILADDMRQGYFRLSADALVLIKGQLANGQHRMWAIIESNTTQSFLMMETDDDELYKVIDCGLRRTAGDVAHINNSAMCSAIANMVIGVQNETISQFSYTKKTPRVELIDFMQQHDDELQEANGILSSLTSKNHNVAPKSCGAALIVLASPKYKTSAIDFLNKLYQGSDPNTCTHDLRERFIKMRMQRGTVQSQYYLALMIKSFNCFLKGTRLGTLKLVDGEAYPKVMK